MAVDITAGEVMCKCWADVVMTPFDEDNERRRSEAELVKLDWTV